VVARDGATKILILKNPAERKNWLLRTHEITKKLSEEGYETEDIIDVLSTYDNKSLNISEIRKTLRQNTIQNEYWNWGGGNSKKNERKNKSAKRKRKNKSTRRKRKHRRSAKQYQ
jgi:hypothetical protein